MTTPSGEQMLFIKSLCVTHTSNELQWIYWRQFNLATMIAWHRRTRNPFLKGIIEDILEDIGDWPRFSWLKREVRSEQARIAASLRAAWIARKERNARSKP